MLKIELSENGQTVIQASGSMADVVAELGLAIGDIYSGLKNNQPKLAGQFKRGMQLLMEDDAPTWSGGLMPGGTYVVMPRK